MEKQPGKAGDQRWGPSSLYQAAWWNLGIRAARMLPASWLSGIGRGLALTYAQCAPGRFEVVRENLLPVFGGDRAAATAAARRNFANFGIKLADLWRYEAGLHLDSISSGRLNEQFLSHFSSPGRGTLLITPHLGNWELGAPMLARHGIKLQVITQAEPEVRLTELRKASRASWGIETLVIGQNPFGFVEVIRRLEEGATVALLIDRPAPSSAAVVRLFDRPFLASLAAAELARASGCRLLPVALPRRVGSYEPVVLGEIDYQRVELGNRDARAKLTQKLMTVFEPVIRKEADQWYHFVPIWPQG